MRTATFLISVGFLLVAGCSERGSTTAASAPSGMTNSELEQAIQSRLNSDPELAAAKIKVDADAKENKVTLSGKVPTESLRTRAVELAKSVRPNLEITDKIEVKPREISRSEYTEQMARDTRERAKAAGDTIGSSIDDAWIHMKITSKLIADRDTPARKINVDVVNGVVTLRGEVNSETAKEEAERIAKETEGVKRVRNLLKVNPA
jgi:osmotically-inducible protein OsmY